MAQLPAQKRSRAEDPPAQDVPAPGAAEPSASGAPEAELAAGGPRAEGAGAGDWIRLSDADAEAVRQGARAHVQLGAGGAGSPPTSSGSSCPCPAEGAAVGTADAEGAGARYVTILRVGGQLRAIDSICYHAGGPLGMGDIEEVGEGRRACLRCPWHHYLVDLETGTKWHQALERNASGKLAPAGWRSSEQAVQRVHDVEEREGGLFVHLRLDGECSSDHFADREDCFQSMRNLGAGHAGGSRGAASHGADGRLPAALGVPSGHVLQRGAAATGAGHRGPAAKERPPLPGL